MRRGWCVIVVCAVTAAGCLTRAERPSAAAVVRSLAPVVPAEGVYLESVILERPVGDRFLDRDLWAETLPVGTQEARTLLSENGLRAGCWPAASRSGSRPCWRPRRRRSAVAG